MAFNLYLLPHEIVQIVGARRGKEPHATGKTAEAQEGVEAVCRASGEATPCCLQYGHASSSSLTPCHGQWWRSCLHWFLNASGIGHHAAPQRCELFHFFTRRWIVLPDNLEIFLEELLIVQKFLGLVLRFW